MKITSKSEKTFAPYSLTIRVETLQEHEDLFKKLREIKKGISAEDKFLASSVFIQNLYCEVYKQQNKYTSQQYVSDPPYTSLGKNP